MLKKPLEILRVGGRLQIVDVSLQQQEGQQQQAAASTAQMLRGADNATLLACIQRMETRHDQQLQAIRSEQLAFRQWAGDQFRLVIANQTRFGGTIQQAMTRGDPQQQQRRRRHTGARQQQQLQAAVNPRPVNLRAAPLPTRNIDQNAKLHPRTQSLSDLWEEFQFGIGDNKTAKTWNTQEKNNKKWKQTCYRRSKVWKLQCYLINTGYSIYEANSRICDVYNSIRSIIATCTRIPGLTKRPTVYGNNSSS